MNKANENVNECEREQPHVTHELQMTCEQRHECKEPHVIKNENDVMNKGTNAKKSHAVKCENDNE